ncbi:uncharacterized protein BO97DRAFT_433219 [Aspergillus homomorphus CBS 101889]|uniref:Aminoglycoside phosphotransferase domain-containing protein n=1 Tax=Aspergillus homomorphus (strain CBS 101889) TaxID=1450537 RepID=A0A395I3A4_ASPHC|nr:hypothetical protein BO97DRAFT_433219 [Aspergillus homomorphus CBS 101889]RAL14093.1 hypothetical protein BO97DRAFT_433219 [Aspergillus homomorphus CBS 101889]
MNYHIEIQFQDGVVWLARIRRSNATSPPPDLQRYIMRSPVGVEYILMEKMPGKNKVMSQLADIFIELQTRPFALMGSLDQPGTDHMRPIGLFTTRKDFLVACIQLTLDLIIEGECYATRPIDAFLTHRSLLDYIPKVCSRPDFDDGRFYLKHADDKGDHILVDDDYIVTGIVDWEWAHTDSNSVAFNSPVFLLPVADFYDGVIEPGEDEWEFARLLEDKGQSDLAEIVRQGRIVHLFNFGLFQGLRRALEADGELEWEAWREKAMDGYKDNEQLTKLILRQSGSSSSD